jgi:hypothetical protein
MARLHDIAADISVYLRFGGELTRDDILSILDGSDSPEDDADQVLELAEARLRRFALSGREESEISARLRGLARRGDGS